MRMTRLLLFFVLAATSMILQAQTSPCSWDQTQSGKITETCGSVGIGLADPQTEIHVKNPNPAITIEATATNGQSRMRFVGGSRTWSFGILPNVSADTKLTLFDYTGSVSRLVVDPVAGGLALGPAFTTPWGGLHLWGAGQTAGNPTVTSTSQASNASTLFLQDNGAAAGNGGMAVFGASNGFFAGLKGSVVDNSGQSTGDLLFLTRESTSATALTERMRIFGATGDVSVSTGFPTGGMARARFRVVETLPSRVWVLDSTARIDVTTTGNYATWTLAGRNYTNAASGVTNTGIVGAEWLEALNTGAGVVASAVGQQITTGMGTGATGSVGTAYGSVISMVGSVSNGYGIRIDDLSATTAWAIYQAGANDQNYFAGRIAIGTTTPDPNTLLDVNGNAHFSGTVTGGNIQAKYQDLAEWVPASHDLTAGTVVVLDSGVANMVTASTKPYDTMVAGVVSAQPGIALGVPEAGKEQVATTGRVKVRVDATRAPIHIGDLLVTSDKPGMAMKSQAVDLGGITMHRPGTIVGKALEPLAGGEGEILVLLSLQ